jgi:hypothetical protein
MPHPGHSLFPNRCNPGRCWFRLTVMRCVAKFVGAGLVLFAVTACGGQSNTAAPASGGALQTSSSVTPVPPAPPSSDVSTPTPSQLQPGNPPGRPKQVVPVGSEPVPVEQIDASGLPDGLPRDVTSSNGGTVLSMQAEEGGCAHVSAAPVAQDAKQVVVNLTQTKAQTGQMCPQYIRNVTISVTLSAPLAQRTLVLKAG